VRNLELLTLAPTTTSKNAAASTTASAFRAVSFSSVIQRDKYHDAIRTKAVMEVSARTARALIVRVVTAGEIGSETRCIGS
jgi:hypothetical protein